MFVTALANEDWLTEEPEVSARKNSKPKCRRLPNAVFDDWRLTLADLFLLIWRARHSDGWTSRPEQLKREHGFGPGLFHPCMNNLKRFGYIKRSQSRNPETGEWEYASEVLSREAAPAGRNGYSLLDTDIPAMPWRQAAMLGYLRSHASNFILSAKKIGKRFSLSSRQVRRIIKPLEKAGQVKLEIVRGERGRVTQKGYVAARESLSEPANSPCGHSPNAVPAMCGKSRAHNRAQPYTSLREISATAASKEAVSRSYTFSAESGKSAGSLQEEAEGRSTAAKAKKAAKERKRFEQFCERAAASIREQRNAGDAGSDIFDDGGGKHLVGLEFFDGISEQELEETLSITDADIRQGVRHTTANRVKKGILGSEGLLSVRRMIARMTQDSGSMTEAFEAVLAAIQKAVADKGRWLNDWNLIARRLAGELYSRGADRVAMTDDEGRSLPGKFRAADWNGVLAPSLFTAKGLAGLRKLIRTHGAEAVHDAVMEYLLRSKTDREIERAHVRNWAYFGKAIAEQTENEP